MLDRHRAALPSWLTLYYEAPIELVRGEGRHVWDADGNRYLDFFAGILTTISGHAVPEIVDALREQAGAVVHTSTLYLSAPMIELAERLQALSGIPDAKVFLTTSGTEANEAALLAATVYRRSNQVLALRNSYHGRSFGTIAITGNRSWSPTSLSGLQVSFVHGGYRLRSPYRDLDDDAYTAACVQDLRDVIDMCTSGDVACMIAEPIQGVGGFATPPDGFFGALHKVLADYGILFISDEVQTGFGRTGDHFWGYQAHDIVPDLLTVAKGVGNGLAIGGVVGRAEVLDSIPAQQHLDVRRQPAGERRRAREPRVPALARPPGQRPQAGRRARERVAQAWRLGTGGSRTCAGAASCSRSSAAFPPLATRRSHPAVRNRGRPGPRRSWKRRAVVACCSGRAACTGTCSESRHR